MEKIRIEITMLASLKTVWDCFTKDKHIKNWYHATKDWKCTKAVNNFKVGGDFFYRMEINNRSFGFDFKGTFDEIIEGKSIKYHLDDGRKAEITFLQEDANTVQMIQVFEPESKNPRDTQRDAWYSVLNNFHKYVEEMEEKS